MIFSLSVIAWHPSLAETYKCREGVIDNEAKLGVNSRDAVSITEDKNDKKCYFSVNGASVNVSMKAKIAAGFDSISTRSIIEKLDEGEISFLAYALLASAPVEDIPDKMREILHSHSGKLSKCLADFFLRNETPKELKSERVQCRVLQKGDGEQIFVTIPTLEIAVQWDGMRIRLFLPQGYR
jgi:hypothetical protein